MSLITAKVNYRTLPYFSFAIPFFDGWGWTLINFYYKLQGGRLFEMGAYLRLGP